MARWIPPAVWAALLLFLGRQEGGKLPAGGIWDLPGFDKVSHALAYGILGLLVGRAARGRPVLAALVAALAVGALDEWGQSFVAGRSADWLDLVADALGAAAGGWLAARTFRRRARSP